MVSRRNVSILTILISSFALLLQFQNCAPTAASGAAGASSGETRVIEDWNKAEIQFISNEVQVHDEAEVTGVGGLCNRSHNGARLRWAIWSDQTARRPLIVGESSCERGEFNVTLDELPNMVCGVKHLLVVEGDWGATTSTQVLRRCQPLASELMSAPNDSPQGTQCSLEYQISADESIGGAPCAQVCYRDDKVVFSQPVAPAQCSGIVAKLAGP